MKYIVTGGAGFVGSHIVDALIGEGHEVHIIDNFFTGKREFVNDQAVLHEIDIRDLDAMRPVFEGVDGVFHCAAQARMQFSIADPLLTHEVDVTGMLNVLLAARDAGVKRVVYSASSSAYGSADVLPVTEDMEAKPIIPYAIMKFVGEKYCTMFHEFYGLETVSLRYFNVYGWRQTTDVDGPYATVIGIFLGKTEKGEAMTVVGDGEQRRDFTHVSDIARANVLAMTSENVGRGEVINVGTGVSYRILDVAHMIGNRIDFISKRPGEVFEVRADNAKASALLGWEPLITFENGIAELKQLHGIKELVHG